MSTVTVVATVENSTDPQDVPRVRLDVTDTGTPNITATTVMRLNPDGNLVPVRTLDGNPLVLTTSGANRVGLLYDYEAPFGQPVTYTTVETPGSSSAQVTVDAADVWLIHPGVPSLSMPVQLRAESLAEEEYGVNEGVFSPMGRTNVIVVTDGTRKGAQSSMTVMTETLDELARIKALIADAGTVLLNIPESLGFGVESQYVAVSAVRVRRVSDIGSDPHRDIVMPYRTVDMPVGGSQSERTFADLLDYPTLGSLMSAYPSFGALLAGP